MFAEVEAPHIRIGDDFLGCPMCEQLARMDDVSTVDHSERFTHIVIGDQDADAAACEVSDEVLDIGNRNRIHTSERFIQKHEIRPRGQGAGYFKPTALAARKSNGRRLAEMADMEFFEK